MLMITIDIGVEFEMSKIEILVVQVQSYSFRS